MFQLKEDGSPVHESMSIERIAGKTNEPSKVKHTKWSGDPKPWADYPIKSKRMHVSAEVHYFYDLAKRLPEGNIANLGVGKGISVAAMAYGLRDSNKRFSKVFGVDLYNHVPDCDVSDLEKVYDKLQLSRYIHLCKGYTHYWAEIFTGLTKFQFVFIDADHHYETTKLDFELYSKLLEPGGLIGFHDVDMNTVNRVIEELDESWELVDHVWKIKTFRRK